MATSPMDQRWGYGTLKPQTDQVYVGSMFGSPDGSYSGNAGGGQVPVQRDMFYDIPTVKSNYMLLSPAAHAEIAQQAAEYNNRDSVPPSWQKTHYDRMVDLSHQIQVNYGARVGPLDAWAWYKQNIGGTPGGADSNSGGGSGGGGGGSAGGTSTSTSQTTSVNLTDPDTARGLVDAALSQYIGRKATTQEQQAFYAALTAHAQANPQTDQRSTTTTSDAAGNSNSTTSSKGGGGFNAQQFAEEFAAGQEGAAEYQAATTFLDSFIKTISQPKVNAL